jgi:hypothetical protein
MKPALRLAIKTESIKVDSVDNITVPKKVNKKIASCLKNLKLGDQIFKPAIKIPAATRLITPVKVKLELINS